MGIVFEKICSDYLMIQNIRGNLPILFTKIGRWWGSHSTTHSQIEIDIVANEGKDYLFCECKWRNDKLDISVLKELKDNANEFTRNRKNTWYVLFSKSGFTDAVIDEAKKDENIILVDLDDIINIA